MTTLSKLIRWLFPEELLPPPDRSVRREIDIADELARSWARNRRQA